MPASQNLLLVASVNTNLSNCTPSKPGRFAGETGEFTAGTTSGSTETGSTVSIEVSVLVNSSSIISGSGSSVIRLMICSNTFSGCCSQSFAKTLMLRQPKDCNIAGR